MKTPHTSAHPGKMVRVVLKDGTVIVDKFVERTGKFVVLRGCKLRGAQIKSLTIYRQSQSKGEHAWI